MEKKNKQRLLSSFLILIILSILIVWKSNLLHVKTENYFKGEIKTICVNDYCANDDDQNINQEIFSLSKDKWKNIKVLDLIAENTDKYESLGFSEKNKVVLKINNRELELGNVSSDWTGTLVKTNNKIYKINVVIDKNNISNKYYWEKHDK